LIKLKAHAKLNLFLDIVSRRQDGFHEIEFVNCQLDLHDLITVDKIDKGIMIGTDDPNLPTDSSNFCYKAAESMINRCDLDCGVNIHIKKNIPYIGGLGGGSADTAEVIKGIDKLFGLNLSMEEMVKIALPLTSDACYCLVGDACRVTGIGEKCEKIAKMPRLDIVLIDPKIGMPKNKTAYMYKSFDAIQEPKHGSINQMVDAIKRQDVEKISKYLFNSFEQVEIDEYRALKKIIKDLIDIGCLNSCLCGSGPTVFGMLPKDNSNIKDKIMKKFGDYRIIFTKTI
jgi:4-diphosphocytidyl-2-C-methyl-D-erythritol kinase